MKADKKCKHDLEGPDPVFGLYKCKKCFGLIGIFCDPHDPEEIEDSRNLLEIGLMDNY